MIEKGLMAEAGMRLVKQAQEKGAWDQIPASRKVIETPDMFLKALNANRKAKAYFDSLTPSYQKQFIGWIGSAKRAETLKKRTFESISLLENRQKLGIK